MLWMPAAGVLILMALSFPLYLLLYRAKTRKFQLAVFNSRLKFWTYLLLRALVLLVLVRSLYLKNYHHTFLCLLSLTLFAIPVLAERKLQIELLPLLEASIFCFIFSAEILGEIQNGYAGSQDGIPCSIPSTTFCALLSAVR